jgi:hypothetical protein
LGLFGKSVAYAWTECTAYRTGDEEELTQCLPPPTTPSYSLWCLGRGVLVTSTCENVDIMSGLMAAFATINYQKKEAQNGIA